MKKDLGEQGLIKTLFGLFLLGVMLTALMLFGKPYYRSYTLGSHTRDYLKIEAGNIDLIKDNIMKNASELGIALNEADISVTMDRQVVKVKAHWKDTVDLWGYYQKTFDFEMYEEF